jgi:hypothetical protein
MTSLAAPQPTFPLLAEQRDFVQALRPGDVLLYSRNGVFNWIIRTKTWSHITHCEVALAMPDSPHIVAASRNGDGCGLYPFDPKGLALVMRPVEGLRPFDVGKALYWYHTMRIGEQGYDWLGLLNFAYARRVNQHNGKMFCSEFAVRFLRKGDLDLFPEQDADTIAPRDLRLTTRLYPVWRSPQEWANYHEGKAYSDFID